MKNKRGEITTALVVLIAAGALIFGTMFPKLNPLNYFKSSRATQTEKHHIKSEVKTPIQFGDKIEFKTEKIESKGNAVFTPKLSLWERITGFIKDLGIWTIIFIVVSVLFFGGAPIVWAIKKYQTVKQTLRNTVSAIREVDEETYNKLKPVLSAKHDLKDKKVIDEIKKELHT